MPRIAAEAGDDGVDGPKVHLGRTNSITYTVQLVTAIDDGDPVAKSEVSIRVQVAKDETDLNTMTLETDDDGQVSFTIEGPDDDEDKTLETRTDTITITYVTDDAASSVGTDQRMVVKRSGGSKRGRPHSQLRRKSVILM